MHENGDRVECRVHGSQGAPHVCRNLDFETPVGFVEEYDPDDPEEESFHAWCSACDEVLLAEGNGTMRPRRSPGHGSSALSAIAGLRH